MPIDTIERTIKRGTGDLEGVIYEQVTYEGYAPHGVAVLVEVLTDNRNRTGSDIRSLFTRSGGNLAEPGAVNWLFERKGVVVVPGTVEEDALMEVTLEAGADDLEDEGGTWRVTSGPSDLPAVRAALEEAGIAFDSADVTMVPSNMVELDTAEAAKSVLRLIDALDDLDDVQDVYANFDVSVEILESIDA